MARKDDALSETVAHILIIFLVVLVTLLIIASLTGVLNTMLQKSAFVAVTASSYDASPTTEIISLYHKQGDKVNLNGTSMTAGSSEVAIILRDPAGSEFLVRNGTLIQADAWGPGQYLYVYPQGSGYRYSDQPPGAVSLPAGEYTIRIIDTKVNVLLHSLPVTIR